MPIFVPHRMPIGLTGFGSEASGTLSMAMQSFTFNRPITLLFSAPLLLLAAMFAYGLSVEFRVSLLVMLLFTLALFCLLAYLSLARRLRIGNGQAEWATPTQQRRMALSEVRHYGVVKFRAFRFIYLSTLEEPPFAGDAKAPQANEDTYVIQYRESAWQTIRAAIQAARPGLQPD